MMFKFANFAFILIILPFYTGSNIAGAAETLYVLPTNIPDAKCPQQPCETLSYYSAESSEYFKSDTAVVLLDGNHDISIGGTVTIKDVLNLEFKAHEYARIICKNYTAFAFLNATNLTFTGIAFDSCGSQIGNDLRNDVLAVYTNASQLFRMSEWQKVAVLLASVYNLSMSSVLIENSTGYGLLGFNVLGVSVIRNSTFSFNNYYTLNSPTCLNAVKHLGPPQIIQDCIGGNALFIYSELKACAPEGQTYQLHLEKSSFAYGVDLTGNPRIRKIQHVPDDNVVIGGAGVSAKIAPASYKIHITLDGVMTSNNNADSGPNLNFQTFDFTRDFAITIRNSVCEFGNMLFNDKLKSVKLWPPFNSGLYYYKGLKLSSSYDSICWSHSPNNSYTNAISISDTSFTRNSGIISGAVTIFFHPQYNYRITEVITIESCSFSSNIQGAILVMEEHGPLTNDVSPLELIIRDSRFQYHDVFNATGLRSYDTHYEATAIFQSARNVTIERCNFSSNSIAAIEAKHATMYIRDELLIWNNTGDIGGGMSFLYSSFMVLQQNTFVFISENHARSKGGAIYVQKSADEDMQPCFFQVMNPNALNVYELNVAVLLLNNTSVDSGSEVYGGTVDSCMRQYVSDKPGPLSPVMYFDYIFFDYNGLRIDNSEQPSRISSDPKQVCHCPYNELEHWRCPQDQPGLTFVPIVVEKSVFPGEIFQVMVVTVGQRKGLVRGVVRAIPFPDPNTTIPLGRFQGTQSVYGCESVSYQVLSLSQIEQFGLAVDRAGEGIPYASIDMHVTLLSCPPGFNITQEMLCDCAPRLKKLGLHCNITERTVERTGAVWVSITSPGNESSSFLVHSHCPFDYCKTSVIKVNLSDPDEQCRFDRSGILCGQCKQNLSAVFGSSKCVECSNRWISLLLVFIVAGILLIAFLIVFDMTVSLGTINGLILFANIVQVNKATFFPPMNETSFLSIVSNFLSVFTAWLNLDLGIEVCFYDKMTAIEKTWLQFAFPIYIWAIVMLIIILARKSTFIVRIIGSNAISVLATLFLLSYAKILQTVISIFSFTSLTYPDNTVSQRWLMDGNVIMARGSHTPLLAFALVFSVFFILPYTLMLLFAPCIQAQSGKWLLDKPVIRNIVPLLDAYQVPYKINFRFWTGLLLLARIVLFLSFAVNVLGDPKINLLITVTAMIAILSLNLHFGYAYQKRILNLIESSFVINLGVLSLWSSFIRVDAVDSVQSQLCITCTLIGLSFIKFAGIFIYHTFLILKRKDVLRHFLCNCKFYNNGYERLAKDEEEEVFEEPVTVVSINDPLQKPSHTTTELVFTAS